MWVCDSFKMWGFASRHLNMATKKKKKSLKKYFFLKSLKLKFIKKLILK